MARILIADDEEGIREFVAEALEDEGHTTIRAADGQAAAARLSRESFDLVITDLKMPGAIDGMALLRKVRADQPEAEVVVLTAHGTVETAVEAMKLGAFDYLQKPLSGPSELRLLVARALERRRLLALRDRSARDAPAVPPLTYGDPVMAPVVEALRRVAGTNTTVLLIGESGTGKEVAARALHAWSARATGPFVAVNCAAMAETLIESELFGHEKGAFTGAVASRRGRIELAEGGTLFLDEIAELRPPLQAKLLRVLQERRFERVGGTRTIEADVRWVAATNRNLDRMIADGTFRDDLYHRIAVFPVALPPLRDRKADLLPLAEALLARVSADLNRAPLRLDAGARRAIASAAWPGNVRELANALERAAILVDGDVIDAAAVRSAAAARPAGAKGRPLDELEREAIERALVETGGNRRIAAERLGIGLRTLYEKLKRYRVG
ncbi:MAG: sigma-54-dependent transcriptional regulator [Hyphomicrobiales bacterium]